MTEGLTGMPAIEAEMRDRLAAKNDEITRLRSELDKWQAAERSLSDAYLRLRLIIPGAYDTPHAPSSEQVWKTTEAAAIHLRSDLERATKALEEIAGWKNDTLGPRPKEFGPFDCDPSISSAFDRGVRMAFYRCADHASAALTEIAH